MAFTDVTVLVSVGSLLVLTCLMAMATVVLAVPGALANWVRRRRNNDRSG